MDNIAKLIEKEWKMFHNVNGEDRADCQDNYEVFEAMRRAQYEAWSAQTVDCYLQDVEQAEQAGRNLAREKYIWMMKDTDPAGFEHWKGELPAVSEEKRALVDAIWAGLLPQTQRMRERYPVLGMGGRPLFAAEAQPGDTSVETYQVGELLTYSEKTLQALLDHLKALEAQGVDLALQIQENSVKCMGYPSMEEAEKAMALQILDQMGTLGSCGCCNCQE